MVVKIGEREVEIKFTFNSFKYMVDFDLTMVSELDTKPFMLIPICQKLLLGALNSDPKEKVNLTEVEKYLKEVVENGDIGELFTELMKALEESNFSKFSRRENEEVSPSDKPEEKKNSFIRYYL